MMNITRIIAVSIQFIYFFIAFVTAALCGADDRTSLASFLADGKEIINWTHLFLHGERYT